MENYLEIHLLHNWRRRDTGSERDVMAPSVDFYVLWTYATHHLQHMHFTQLFHFECQNLHIVLIYCYKSKIGNLIETSTGFYMGQFYHAPWKVENEQLFVFPNLANCINFLGFLAAQKLFAAKFTPDSPWVFEHYVGKRFFLQCSRAWFGSNGFIFECWHFLCALRVCFYLSF